MDSEPGGAAVGSWVLLESTTMVPALRLEQLNKSFSGVRVLKDVNLRVSKPGSILGLVGENGAGKSTMMNILGGVLSRDSGEMLLEGKKYDPKSAVDADEAGIAFIHQELNLFQNMTVAENLFLNRAPRTRLGLLSYRAMNRQAKTALDRVGIEIHPATRVESLSMGVRQMVEIAKALTRKARLVVFDEPTTSLSTTEKQHLFAIIRDLAQKQISTIYISHTLDDVLSLCDEVAVIRDGSIIGQWPIGEMNKEKMISTMVGRKLEQLFPYVEKSPGPRCRSRDSCASTSLQVRLLELLAVP